MGCFFIYKFANNLYKPVKSLVFNCYSNNGVKNKVLKMACIKNV